MGTPNPRPDEALLFRGRQWLAKGPTREQGRATFRRLLNA
jgi:hypothetical protein